MRLGGYEITVPRAVVVAFAVVVVGALLYGGATSVAAFGAFNPSWEGSSDLRAQADEAGAETAIATNTTTYEAHGNDTVAVVLAPSESYNETEIERIQAFLDRGGTLLVADRSGTASELLAALGAEARVDGALLRDERDYYRDPALPVANNVSNHTLTSGVDALTLNYGTAVEPGESTVLVSSSEFGYLDRDRNDRLDDDETLGSYPVATTEPAGEGRVVVVGDASAFINAMAERDGNRAFATNLFEDAGTVLIDTTHSGDLPPLIAALLAVRASPALQGGLVGVALVLVFGWQQGIYSRETNVTADGRPDPEALADAAAEKYPSLDRSRLGRLMKGIKSISSGRDDDE